MELAQLPYKKGCCEDYTGAYGLEKRGKQKWRNHVADVVAHLVNALQPDDVILGGGDLKEFQQPAIPTRTSDNRSSNR